MSIQFLYNIKKIQSRFRIIFLYKNKLWNVKLDAKLQSQFRGSHVGTDFGVSWIFRRQRDRMWNFRIRLNFPVGDPMVLRSKPKIRCKIVNVIFVRALTPPEPHVCSHVKLRRIWWIAFRWRNNHVNKKLHSSRTRKVNLAKCLPTQLAMVFLFFRMLFAVEWA